MIRTILDGGIRDASIVELVLAVATAFSLNALLVNIAQRGFGPDGGMFQYPPASVWLYPQLTVFVLLALLLAMTTYRRVRSYEIEDEVDVPTELA